MNENSNRIKKETIEKYYNCLVKLREILKYTNRISINDFAIDNNLSKMLSNVLSKGDIIRCKKKGRYSEWEWIATEPTMQMAIKTIKLLTLENPPRKKALPKPIESIKPIVKLTNKKQNKVVEVSLFWGFFKFKFNI